VTFPWSGLLSLEDSSYQLHIDAGGAGPGRPSRYSKSGTSRQAGWARGRIGEASMSSERRSSSCSCRAGWHSYFRFRVFARLTTFFGGRPTPDRRASPGAHHQIHTRLAYLVPLAESHGSGRAQDLPSGGLGPVHPHNYLGQAWPARIRGDPRGGARGR
jgi:hypothetical protein